MQRRTILRAAVLAGAFLALVVFAQSTRADLIQNGGFEQPPVPGTYPQLLDVPGGSGLITGWTTLGNDVLLIGNSYSEPGNGVTFNAQSGNQSLDITGVGNTGPTDGITQTVNGTTAGQAYTLTFWVGKATSNLTSDTIYVGPASVGLKIDGGAVMTFTNSNSTPGAVNWQQFSIQFVATGSSTAITFLNETPVGTNYAGLDGVTLNAVPEPGPLTLCAAGLPLFLGISWFRNRRASR